MRREMFAAIPRLMLHVPSRDAADTVQILLEEASTLPATLPVLRLTPTGIWTHVPSSSRSSNLLRHSHRRYTTTVRQSLSRICIVGIRYNLFRNVSLSRHRKSPSRYKPNTPVDLSLRRICTRFRMSSWTHLSRSCAAGKANFDACAVARVHSYADSPVMECEEPRTLTARCQP